MNLNIAVVDDTRLDSEKLQRNIHKWFTENTANSQTVTCFRDGEALLAVKSLTPESRKINMIASMLSQFMTTEGHVFSVDIILYSEAVS